MVPSVGLPGFIALAQTMRSCVCGVRRGSSHACFSTLSPGMDLNTPIWRSIASMISLRKICCGAPTSELGLLRVIPQPVICAHSSSATISRVLPTSAPSSCTTSWFHARMLGFW